MAKPVGWGKKYVFLRPEGQVRQSQIITTYGAGALIDLVDQAVLVGGLDFWSYGSAKGIPIIQEPRLRDALAESFRIAGRPLSFEHAFREPPAGDDASLSGPSGSRCSRCRAGSCARTAVPRARAKRRPRPQRRPLPAPVRAEEEHGVGARPIRVPARAY